jgi:uncharacterized membrane protein HdeD (DUF308 family)
MKLTNKIGVLLLAIWLILSGLIAVLALTFQGMNIVMGILAILAGAFLIVDR